MLQLMFITNNIDIAKYVCDSGVDRIFIDLEWMGKQERQGHRDTWISRHAFEDIKPLKQVIGEKKLLVRLNPLYIGTEQEVNDAIDNGADILMLPMFRTLDELKSFLMIVDARVPVIPLVETPEALNALASICQLPGVSEIYLGLNDLHLAVNSQFMFEPLSNGLLENAVEIINESHLPWGFGGIARVGEGELPAELIVAEHERLGSTAVILSRTFHRQATALDELLKLMDFKSEIQQIRQVEAEAALRTKEQRARDKVRLDEIIDGIVKKRTYK